MIKKCKIFIMIAVLMLCLVGCQKKDETAASVAETTVAAETTTTKATEAVVETTAEVVKKAPPIVQQTSEFDVVEGVIKMTLPESWRDSYYYNVFTSKKDTSVMVAFYESKDYHADGTGWLCSVRQMEGNNPDSYTNLEYYAYLGEVRCVDEMKYGIIVEFPTDVQASAENMELYATMYQDIYLLIASMEVLDGSEFIPNPGYYGYFGQTSEDDFIADDSYDFDEDYEYGMSGDYNLEGWQNANMQDGVEEGFLYLGEDGDGMIYTESLGSEMQISWYDAGDDTVAIRIGDDQYEGYYYPELAQIRVKIGEKVYYFVKV